jgi:hypothetical protein
MTNNFCGQPIVCICNQADGSILPLLGIMEAKEFVSTIQDRMMMKMMMSNNNNSSGRGTDDNQNDIIDQTV